MFLELYIILLKTRELVHVVTGKKKTLNFRKPNLVLERDYTQEIRDKIMNISYTEWKNLGDSTGTLHQLKKKVEENKGILFESAC